MELMHLSLIREHRLSFPLILIRTILIWIFLYFWKEKIKKAPLNHWLFLSVNLVIFYLKHSGFYDCNADKCNWYLTSHTLVIYITNWQIHIVTFLIILVIIVLDSTIIQTVDNYRQRHNWAVLVNRQCPVTVRSNATDYIGGAGLEAQPQFPIIHDANDARLPP